MPAQLNATCSQCMKISADGITYMRCGRCLAVFYCGRECQRKDWRAHKKYCAKADESPSPESAASVNEVKRSRLSMGDWINHTVTLLTRAKSSAFNLLPDAPGPSLIESHILLIFLRRGDQLARSRTHHWQPTAIELRSIESFKYKSSLYDSILEAKATSAKRVTEDMLPGRKFYYAVYYLSQDDPIDPEWSAVTTGVHHPQMAYLEGSHRPNWQQDYLSDCRSPTIDSRMSTATTKKEAIIQVYDMLDKGDIEEAMARLAEDAELRENFEQVTRDWRQSLRA